MKQGINLGPPAARSLRPLVLLLAAAGAGALLLAVLYQRARSDVEKLGVEVARLSESLEASTPGPSSEGAQFIASRLRLALDSGAPESVPPTGLLRLVTSALPEGTRLDSLSFNANPRPILTLDASTLGGDHATELQRRLASSPLVAATSLLEERRLPDGRLAIRVQVVLERP